MTVEAWSRTPVYTIAGVGPYPITHPYADGAIRVAVIVAGARVALTGTDFSVTPTAADIAGDLFLSPGAAATHAGRSLVIDRLTPDEQGWLATQGEREAGLAAQLDRMVQSVQEVREDVGGAIRVREPLTAFEWDDGTVPLRDGSIVRSGPTAGQITAAQANAETATAKAAEAAASAAAAATFDPALYLAKEGNLSGLLDLGAALTNLGFSAFARMLLDDADAAAARATLGAQATDASLTSLAGQALAAGDLLYATGAKTLVKLGMGAPGQVLRPSSGLTAPEWGSAAISWQAEVATTSGDDIVLSSSIPNWATEVHVPLRSVSLSGTDNVLLQLGTAGGYVVTGYTSSCGIAGGVTGGANSTAGALVYLGSGARAFSGFARLHKVTGNIWSFDVCGGDGANNVVGGGGHVDLGGVLTQIRLSTSGPNTFDAGAASVGWR